VVGGHASGYSPVLAADDAYGYAGFDGQQAGDPAYLADSGGNYAAGIYYAPVAAVVDNYNCYGRYPYPPLAFLFYLPYGFPCYISQRNLVFAAT